MKDIIEVLNPRIITVTSGALATGEKCWRDLVNDTSNTLTYLIENGINPEMLYAHVPGRGRTYADMYEIVQGYQKIGVQKFLALRGDAPGDGDFPYTKDLIRFLNQSGQPSDNIAVAGYPEGHPEAKASLRVEVDRLWDKLEEGADLVLLQFCFDVKAMERFYNLCAQKGVSTEKIVPGVMPIWKNWLRYLERAKDCGVIIPVDLHERLNKLYNTSDSDYELWALDAVVEFMLQVNQQIEIRDFHMYAGMYPEKVKKIFDQLGAPKRLITE